MNYSPLPTQDRLHELFYCVGGKLIRKVDLTPTFRTGDVIGCAHHKGHLVTCVDRKQYKVHRLVWKWYYGTDPVGQIDHVDRNPINNNIWNLRDATPATNAQNNTRTMDDHKGQLQSITIDGVRRRTDYGNQVQAQRIRDRRKL